jgi:hypothetical protein
MVEVVGLSGPYVVTNLTPPSLMGNGESLQLSPFLISDRRSAHTWCTLQEDYADN